MKILFVSAEVAPLVKTGGLADVAGALPQALRRIGHDVRIAMPGCRRLQAPAAITGPHAAAFLQYDDTPEEVRIRQTTLGEVPVYLLDIPAAFDREAVYGAGDDDRRFVLFSHGVMTLLHHLREVEAWQPEVVQSNDWHTALISNYIRTRYSYTFGHLATVYTIHNLAYQGWFGEQTARLAGLWQGENYINFMARGIIYADVVSTVSPTYAQEILTPEYGEQLDGLLRARRGDLYGILNGIDLTVYDPASDPYLPATYSIADLAGKAICKAQLQQELGLEVSPQRPLIGMVTRMVEQKGMDLLEQVMPWLIETTDAQLVLLGSPHPHWEGVFRRYAAANPGRVAVEIAFDLALSQRIYAGADIFLMPSRYEPCGLGQLIALRYGTVPIVRVTGGLADTISEGYEGNGFRFHGYTAGELADAIGRCLATYRDPLSWAALRERGMRQDFSWDASARAYEELYRQALARRYNGV
ncbi:MAG TPA: glycogen synthase [Roseiflexaceae bacterium]|nr:glycogen synthase [Roseiflexaceae bacterium]